MFCSAPSCPYHAAGPTGPFLPSSTPTSPTSTLLDSPRSPTMAPSFLHIRKPSCSDSLSTISSPSPRTPVRAGFAPHHQHPAKRQTQLEFDPLSLHPVYPIHHQSPPPRLAERPFLFYQASKQEELPLYQRHEVVVEQPLPIRPGSGPRSSDLELQFGMDMSPIPTPPLTPPTGHDRTTPRAGARFNLTLELPSRSLPPRSRWSDSTIQSVEGLDVDVDDDEQAVEDDDDELDSYPSSSPVSFVDDDVDDDRPTSPRYIASSSTELEFKGLTPATRQPRTGSIPTVDLSHSLDEESSLERPRPATEFVNFSYKRNTVPRRPEATAHGANSVENFLKRGGWKRRGIVFEADAAGDRTSAHTIS